MNIKTMSVIFLLLLASQGFILFFTPISNIDSEMNDNQEMAINQNFEISEVDLDRVNLQSEAFENGDAEDWITPHDPADLYTSRTTDRLAWYQFGIKTEGLRSLGMRARGADINHPAYSKIYLRSWTPLAAYNLTISLDWRVEQVGYPELGDRMELFLPFSDGRNVRYCMAGDIDLTNTSTTVYYIIDDSLGTWHKLERNVTNDYIEAFGLEPALLSTFSFFAHSYGPQYTYGYFDDFYLVRNGTVIVGGGVNHGNFEQSGSGTTWYNFNSVGGFGDISSSTDRIEGDFSLNTTVMSSTYQTQVYPGRSICTAYIYRMVSDDNRDVFTFSWKVTNIELNVSDSYSYMRVSIENATDSYSVYYVTAAGGPIIPDLRSYPDDIQFNLGNVNETGDWMTLNTSIYEDVQSVREDKNIYISSIQIYTQASTAGAKLTVLYDNMSFISTTFSDRDYEHLGPLGSNVPGWYGDYYGCDCFTVTDFSYSGDKAGNFTVSDDYEEWIDKSIDDAIHINSENEMVLDITWHMEYNQSSEDFFILYLEIGDHNFNYIIMNTTNFSDDIISEDDCTFILPETNTESEWINWKIDIAHDYEQSVGEFPNTTLDCIALWGYANSSSTFTVFIDDFYLYEDSAPEITDISQNPTSPEAGDNTEISVTVKDATALDVTLHHRAGTDSWTNTTMIDAGNNVFEANLTNSPWDVEVEYFVSAVDAFNKTDEIMDGASYFTFTVVDTIAPVISLAPANGTTVSDIVSILINVTESGSGFANSELFIEGVSIANITQDSVGIAWNTTVVPDGVYNITVVASDIAGNSAVVTHLLTVDNSVTTTTTTTTGTEVPQDFTGAILIIVVIAIIGAVVVIYIFVLKKR